MMLVCEDSLDSNLLEKLVIDAEQAIKSLKENPSIPRAAEVLENFLRDFDGCRTEESTTCSSKVSSDEKYPQWTREKLVVFLSKEIGHGTDGTVVFEGSYEGRLVAVKRLQESHVKLAKKEIQNLIASDHGQNIVRYHGMEYDERHVYLALELCHCNLSDLIQIYSAVSPNHQLASNNLQGGRFKKLKNIFGDVNLWKGNIDRPSRLLQELMRDMVSGLVHLHKQDISILHRDLKPQNVLIRKEDSALLAKLSDMGISRRLSGKDFLSDHSSDNYAGTGWKAREQLLRKQQTRAMDLFSLGCILFFCITKGNHPFGKPDERDCNIKKKYVKELSSIQHFPEAFHLISPLLEADPKKRPEANVVLHHPLFWNAKKRLYFLRDSSDCTGEDANLRRQLESTAGTVFGTKLRGKVVINWKNQIDEEVIALMGQRRPYDHSSLLDLLRLIRNMLNHYHDKNLKDIQNFVGQLYEGFDDYFTRKFPKLFLEVYKVVHKCCKDDEFFKIYFEGDQ